MLLCQWRIKRSYWRCTDCSAVNWRTCHECTTIEGLWGGTVSCEPNSDLRIRSAPHHHSGAKRQATLLHRPSATGDCQCAVFRPANRLPLESPHVARPSTLNPYRLRLQPHHRDVHGDYGPSCCCCQFLQREEPCTLLWFRRDRRRWQFSLATRSSRSNRLCSQWCWWSVSTS